MNCLTDIEIQTVADGEANAAATTHAAECQSCHGRVEARRREMQELSALMSDDARVSPQLSARVRQAVSEGAQVRGATALRAMPALRWRPIVWLATSAAGVALVVFLILPKLGAPTSLSASEILGRSLKTMSATSGIELLEYSLFVAGEMPGPHRIEQLIDHDHAGRYRISNYGPDGALESALEQDPESHRRSHLIRVDGRNYIINVDLTAARGPRSSLPEIAQAMIETSITMMQAKADPGVTVVETPTGRQFIVEIPPVTAQSSAAAFDIYRARAVIDETDFRIREFEASGSLLKQPYSISFSLIRRNTRPSADVPAAEFRIAVTPNDVVLEGKTDGEPATDLLPIVLRELARAKGFGK